MAGKGGDHGSVNGVRAQGDLRGGGEACKRQGGGGNGGERWGYRCVGDEEGIGDRGDGGWVGGEREIGAGRGGVQGEESGGHVR